MEKTRPYDMEILAPVGGRQQLVAAVRSGADAVYLGLSGFNARRNAENFDAESLPEAVSYCHGRGVKVHVTVNTLIMDGELHAAEETLRDIARAGADAVIVQDLAVADMVRKSCPDISMHASTQMAVHNVSGVKALEALGFSRVVLARELTLSEIRKIAESTNLEIECFVHGALCMSASGLCELSAMIGGRSGNRGLCAQPCRLDFQCRGRDHALSLKDMSLIQALPELYEAGVRSVKIEGRMKRPEYVAAAVTACRKKLAGEEPDMETLRAVFSRSGFTDGYLTGKRDLSMFGYRTKEDVVSAQPVLKDIAQLYRAERQSVPVDMSLTVCENEPAALSASDGKQSVKVFGAVPEKARTAPLTEELVEKFLSRTGGTPFYLDGLSARLEDALTIPASELNRMRREALDELLARRERVKSIAFGPYPAEELSSHEAGAPALRLRFFKAEQIFDAPEAEKIILPVSEIKKRPELISLLGEKLVGELPALSYPMAEEKLRDELEELAEMGLKHLAAGNIGAVITARELGFTVHGGASLNILNTVALERYRELGLSDATVSAELSMRDIGRLGGDMPRGVLAYGRIPLMKLRACPAQSENGCGDCRGASVLTDRKGESFPLVCRERQYSELLNCVPVYIGDKPIRGVDFCTLYFTIEDKDTCRRVAELFLKRAAPDFRRTGGLYYRELL